MFWKIHKLIRNILDCDQSYYSSRCASFFPNFLHSCSLFHASASFDDNPFHISSKFQRWRPTTTLGLIEPEIEPFDPPTLKTPPENQTWSGSDDPLLRYRHSKFSKWEVGESSVAGRWSVVNIYILTLTSYTPHRYVSARGVKYTNTTQIANDAEYSRIKLP